MSSIRQHWPEYLLEAVGLGLFMISASVFCILLEHPASPASAAFGPLLRRGLMGLAMGGTAIALIYSPLGQRSGAHLNPAVTLTFLRLGKIAPGDALFYVLAQFIGGAIGVALVALTAPDWVGHPNIHYVVTAPGPNGVAIAFAGELAISFLLMLVVLAVSNHRLLTKYTGLFAGGLVATYILVEAPLSGMSMNPARTLASALSAHDAAGLWIYFTAPPLGMLLAAQLHHIARRGAGVYCAKLNHLNDKPCIFRCRFAKLVAGE